MKNEEKLKLAVDKFLGGDFELYTRVQMILATWKMAKNKFDKKEGEITKKQLNKLDSQLTKLERKLHISRLDFLD